MEIQVSFTKCTPKAHLVPKQVFLRELDPWAGPGGLGGPLGLAGLGEGLGLGPAAAVVLAAAQAAAGVLLLPGLAAAPQPAPGEAGQLPGGLGGGLGQGSLAARAQVPAPAPAPRPRRPGGLPLLPGQVSSLRHHRPPSAELGSPRRHCLILPLATPPPRQSRSHAGSLSSPASITVAPRLHCPGLTRLTGLMDRGGPGPGPGPARPRGVQGGPQPITRGVGLRCPGRGEGVVTWPSGRPETVVVWTVSVVPGPRHRTVTLGPWCRTVITIAL